MAILALVAHDNTKPELLKWAKEHRATLERYTLVGTEKTAKLLRDVLELDVEDIGHGPDGGDIILAGKILQGEIDRLVFFIDVRNPHGHEHEIQTLIRTCVLKDIPLALNPASADHILEA
jgi:methylglyoxal synthase